MASTADMISTGEQISSLSSDVSINSAGRVAMVATLKSGSTTLGSSLLVSDSGPGSIRNVGFGPSPSRDYAFPQINDNNQVIARDRLSGAPPATFIRRWDEALPGVPTTLVASGWEGPLGCYDSVTLGTLAPDYGVGFIGLTNNSSTTALYYIKPAGDPPILNVVKTVTGGGFRPLAANGGRIAIRDGSDTNGSIFLNNTPIASTLSGWWASVGAAPGTSTDGKMVTFFGDLTEKGASAYNYTLQPAQPLLSAGPGIFASVDVGGYRVIARVAGISADFPGFAPDDRVAVNSTFANLGYDTVTFSAQDPSTGHVQGIYTSQISIGPDPVNAVGISEPSKVIKVGDTIPSMGQAVADLSVGYGPINDLGQVAFEAKVGSNDVVVRARPLHQPVLVVPGIGGVFAKDPTKDKDWLLNRGVGSPDQLKEDPLLHVYDDLIQSLINAGYVRNRDLFVVNYDWRVPVGPPFDGSYDGHIDGLTGKNISDRDGVNQPFASGVQYLGYYLKQAAVAWSANHPNLPPLQKVDIIAHSTGGLITRTYLQSDAYGDYYDPTHMLRLPTIDHFVMVGVPNQGASKPWNILHDNWSIDMVYGLVFSKVMNRAYQKLVQSTDPNFAIGGANPITLESIRDPATGQPSHTRFIKQYVPTAIDLLATYDCGETDPDLVNKGLLDLNGGADRNAFADKANVIDIYGWNQWTPTFVEHQSGFGATQRFDERYLIGHEPGDDEVVYTDIFRNNGDGTVPLQSSASQFLNDSRVTMVPIKNGTHTGLMSKLEAQRQILKTLGFPLKDNQISLPPLIQADLPRVKALAFTNDPLKAGILVDDSGRRLGYTPTTGVLTEIPNSVWLGGADGQGFVFGPVGPLQLQLTGQGANYYVMVDEVQDGQFGGVKLSGFLGDGEQVNMPITLGTIPGYVPPTAVDDTVTANKNTPIIVDELANDQMGRYAIDPRTVAISTTPQFGGVSVDPATGRITYTPNASYLGPDHFTYTVKDINGVISNPATVTVVTTVVDHFQFTLPASVTAGVPFDETIAALDASNNTVNGYYGTVDITTSSGQLVRYTFTGDDSGQHTFPGIRQTKAQLLTINATDRANPAVTGSAALSITPAAATHFHIRTPAMVNPGQALDVTISAADPYDNVDTSYLSGAEVVHFSTTDPAAQVALPPDFQFTADMQGTVTFAGGVKLYTTGNQRIFATDAASGLNDDGKATVKVIGGSSIVFWTNHSGGSWRDPNNWSTGQLPGPADDVIIDVPENITVTYNFGYPIFTTIHSLLSENALVIRHPYDAPSAGFSVLTTAVVDNNLTLGIQTFEARQGLTVNGLLTWTTVDSLGSTILTRGRVRPNGGMLVSGTYPTGLSGGGRLDNPGTVTIAPGAGGINLSSDFTWNNLPDSNLVIQSDSGVHGGTVNNAGTIRRSIGGLTAVITGVLHNTGTVIVEWGTLGLEALADGNGSFVIQAGAMLEFYGVEQVLSSGAVVSGAGDVRFRGGITYVRGNYNLGGTTYVGGNTVPWGTAHFTHDVTLPSLTLNSGGVVEGLGTVTVTGLLTWTGGTMRGPGRIVANGGVMINAPATSNPTLDGRTFDNAGTATWTGMGPITVMNGATWNNLAGAVFDAQSDLRFADSPGLPSSFNNAGILRKSSSIGTTTLRFVLNNTGLVDVQTGTLSFIGEASTGGTFAVAANAVLDITPWPGVFTFNQASRVTGMGSVSFRQGLVHIEGVYDVSGPTIINGGIADFLSDVTLGALTLNSGTLSGPTTVRVTGLLDWTGGAMIGPGRTVANSSLMIHGWGTRSLASRTLDNAAAATWTDGGILYSDYDVTWNNLPGATFVVRNNLSFDAGPGAVFNNAGTFRKVASTGTTRMGLAFNNTGDVAVQTGMLSLTGDGVSSGGFTVQAGAVLEFSANGNDITTISSVSGAGEVRFSSGTVFVLGSYGITGLTNVGGGTAVLVMPASTGSLMVNYMASLQVFGDLSVPGRFDWLSGSLFGPGRIRMVGPTATIAISGWGTKLLDGCTIDNGRTATCTGADISFADGAIWNNLLGATFDVRGDLNFILTDGTLATINNAGTFRKTLGSTRTTIGTRFNNQGTVDVQIGTLALTRGGVSTGAFTIAAGSTLSFGIISGTENYILSTGTTIRGDGFATVAGGYLVIGDRVAVDNFQLDVVSAGLTGVGNLVVANAFHWMSGQLADVGSLDISPTATLTISGTDWKSLYRRTINNAGSTIWMGNGDITLDQNAVINNLSGATFSILNDRSLLGNGTFNNLGTVSKTAATGTTAIDAGIGFFNRGTVSLQSGTLSVGGPYTQTGGTTDIRAGAALNSANGMNIQGGILSGAGTINGSVTVQNGGTLSGSETINGNVTNSGQLNPGGTGTVGVLTINGNYTQTATGVLNIAIGGPNAGSDFDQLKISGTATLGGTLNVSLLNGYVPPSATTFKIVTFGSHGTSIFQTINLDPRFQGALYNEGDVTLVAN
jgi:hypothetical protein